jgi:hypothetical protein
MAAAQVARTAAAEVSEPITEADLLACIDEYNRTEAAAHELRRVICLAVSKRTGYRMVRFGPDDSFNGRDFGNAAPSLCKVESLGSEV